MGDLRPEPESIAMKHYVGLDVSLAETAVCVVDREGCIVLAACVASQPQAIAGVLCRRAGEVVRVVLESGQLSTWLARELRALGWPVVCVDARQAHRALSGRLNKSDAADAEGLAQLARTGWYREVHVKSLGSDRLRALLGARDRLIRMRKDLESQIRGTLKAFGIRLGQVKPGKEREGFRVQVRMVAPEDPAVKAAISALLAAHRAICQEYEQLDARLRRSARDHELITRMMTVPGVGPITAAAFIAVIDRPERFKKAASVAAYIGLTPRRYQSGEVDYSGRISKSGDAMLRACLYEAAVALLSRVERFSALKSWGVRLAARKGFRKAAVAVARKLAVILFRIWADATKFRWSREATMAAA
jgi:transposase